MAYLRYTWPEKTHRRPNGTQWTLEAGEWFWPKLEAGTTYHLYQFADPVDSKLERYRLRLAEGEPPSLPPSSEVAAHRHVMSARAHRVSMGVVTFTTPHQDGAKFSFHTAEANPGLLKRWIWTEMETVSHGTGKAELAVARQYADGACVVPIHSGSHALAHVELSHSSLMAAQKDRRLLVLPSLYSRKALPAEVSAALAKLGVTPEMTLHDALSHLAEQEPLFTPEI